MWVPTWYEVGICRKVVHSVIAAYGYTTWRNHTPATQSGTKNSLLSWTASSFTTKETLMPYLTFHVQNIYTIYLFLFECTSMHMLVNTCMGHVKNLDSITHLCLFLSIVTPLCPTADLTASRLWSHPTPDSSWLQTRPVTCSSLSLKNVWGFF